MGEFLKELWAFMKERKKFWLLPIIVMLVLLGSLIVLTQGSAVAPFIYTLFFFFNLPLHSSPLCVSYRHHDTVEDGYGHWPSGLIYFCLNAWTVPSEIPGPLSHTASTHQEWRD